MYTPTTSCVKKTCGHIKNTWIKLGLRFCCPFPGCENFEKRAGPRPPKSISFSICLFWRNSILSVLRSWFISLTLYLFGYFACFLFRWKSFETEKRNDQGIPAQSQTRGLITISDQKTHKQYQYVFILYRCTVFWRRRLRTELWLPRSAMNDPRGVTASLDWNLPAKIISLVKNAKVQNSLSLIKAAFTRQT